MLARRATHRGLRDKVAVVFVPAQARFYFALAFIDAVAVRCCKVLRRDCGTWFPAVEFLLLNSNTDLTIKNQIVGAHPVVRSKISKFTVQLYVRGLWSNSFFGVGVVGDIEARSFRRSLFFCRSLHATIVEEANHRPQT